MAPQTVSDIVWMLFLGACSLLLFGINLWLVLIHRKMSWIDKFMHKWRGEEMNAINELQGRCTAAHPNLPPIAHRLTVD